MSRIQCWIREPFCGLSHFVGVGLSIAALVTLLVLAQGRPWHVVSFAIYGASLILLYTASALYHSLPVRGKALDRLQRFDHSAIFLLIAGTYAPICLVSLRGVWGWTLLAIEYTLAAVGIAAVLLLERTPSWLRVVLYAGMGWLALIAIQPLLAVFPPAALAWLFAGGLIYTFGTLIYAMDRPHLWPGRFSAHDLWHLFVMGGSACHYVLIMCFVA